MFSLVSVARDSSKSVLRCVTGRACVRRPADGVGSVRAVTARSDFLAGCGVCSRHAGIAVRMCLM